MGAYCRVFMSGFTETIVIEACAILFALFVWNALCNVLFMLYCCSAVSLLQPAYCYLCIYKLDIKSAYNTAIASYIYILYIIVLHIVVHNSRACPIGLNMIGYMENSQLYHTIDDI